MNKVYTIYPKVKHNQRIMPPALRKSIHKEIQVIFTSGKVKLEKGKPYQTVTTCVFRNHLSLVGVGCSIENPNDERDAEEGMRWAFKRAIQSLLNNLDYRKSYYVNKRSRKEVDRAFRLALRYAKENKNGN